MEDGVVRNRVDNVEGTAARLKGRAEVVNKVW